MEIKVDCRAGVKKAVIESVSAFLATELNLTKSKYTLRIGTVSNLSKEDRIKGAVVKVGDTDLMMVLDSRLSIMDLLHTLAHEMVHVKQYAKGQLKECVTKSGKTYLTWMGRRTKRHPFTSPWELEAYGREVILVNRVACKLDKSIGK